MAARGYPRVAGVDEAGRGPLAGPVTAAAVVLPPGFSCDRLDDSKKLSAKVRSELYLALTGNPEISWAVAVVDPEEIDRINILRATYRAMGLALEKLHPSPAMALIDGRPVKGLAIRHEAVVKGDGISLSIAAASVIAKVTRDRIMASLDGEFPVYGFIRNQGYGTREHLEAIQKHGPCRHHRRTFQPVSQLTLPLG